MDHKTLFPVLEMGFSFWIFYLYWQGTTEREDTQNITQLGHWKNKNPVRRFSQGFFFKK